MRQEGFILLDVLLALAVLAIALPVLVGLANRDIEMIAYARSLTTATLLAQEKLLETEAGSFPPIGRQSGDYVPFPGTIAQKVRDQRESFQWSRTVDATPLEEVREVRVRIAWPRGRTEEMVEVTSYVLQEPDTSSSSRLYPR